MRGMLCLLLLMIEGAALLVTSPSFFGLLPLTGGFSATYWHVLLPIVAIPLSLLLLLFTKLDFVRTLVLIWGLLLSMLSIGYLFSLETSSPSINLYGKLFVIGVMITSVALTIFESIELFELPIQIKAAKNASPDSSQE